MKKLDAQSVVGLDYFLQDGDMMFGSFNRRKKLATIRVARVSDKAERDAGKKFRCRSMEELLESVRSFGNKFDLWPHLCPSPRSKVRIIFKCPQN